MTTGGRQLPDWQRRSARDIRIAGRLRIRSSSPSGETTRDWSMADFRAHLRRAGRAFRRLVLRKRGRRRRASAIVEELLDAGIAEICEGLPVVKIDEKLGLNEETYRTMPILRSDGTTLYSTKDLALTKRKFEEYGVDRAIWVVDARQSLYFQQIFKILELWGFEQAKTGLSSRVRDRRLARRASSPRARAMCRSTTMCAIAVLARAREIIEEKNRDCAGREKAEVAWRGGARLAEIRDAGARQQQGRHLRSGRSALLRRPFRALHPVRARARLPHSRARGGTPSEMLPPAGSTIDFGDIKPEELALLQEIASLPDEIAARRGGVPAAADRVVRLRAGEALQRLLSRLPGAAIAGADAHRPAGAGRGHPAGAGKWSGVAGHRGTGRNVGGRRGEKGGRCAHGGRGE